MWYTVGATSKKKKEARPSIKIDVARLITTALRLAVTTSIACREEQRVRRAFALTSAEEQCLFG
jgi:hypothetical protein